MLTFQQYYKHRWDEIIPFMHLIRERGMPGWLWNPGNTAMHYGATGALIIVAQFYQQQPEAPI